jgi:hypothetical protein
MTGALMDTLPYRVDNPFFDCLVIQKRDVLFPGESDHDA